MTTTTAANPFDRQYDAREKCYDVIDTRTGALIRSFFIEDGAAAMRALELADALWYNELIAATEVAPEPTEPTPSTVTPLTIGATVQIDNPRAPDFGCVGTITAVHFADTDSPSYVVQPNGEAYCRTYGAGELAIIVDNLDQPAQLVITSPDQIPEALVAAAWGLVPDPKHAHNEGRWYLLTWQHQPALWAGIWAAMSLTERDDALRLARLAGATPYELSAMAGVSLFHDSAPVELTRAA